MNKARLFLSLMCAGALCIFPVQASLFPPQIEKLCQPVADGGKSDNCLKAQIFYLESVLKTIYAMAYATSSDKKLLEREQSIFETLRKPSGQWYSIDYDYNDLLTRILELASSVYPEPVFPKQTVDECKKYGREYNMEPRNCEATQDFVKKAVEENYKKALASVQDKTALEESQLDWLSNSKSICDFGNIRDVWDAEKTCTYYWNLLRADELAEMAKEGKVIPGVLEMALTEQNQEMAAQGDSASYENLPNPFSPKSGVDLAVDKSLIPDSTSPAVDLTDVNNIKRIQTALSGIYKWIPTKSNDLAAMHYAAIHDFQERNGMPISNKITQDLMLRLEQAASGRQQAGTEKIFLDFDSPKYVEKTQSLLQQVGYAVPRNGVLDLQTENAIKDFQSKNGVKVTGKVGPFLIQQLENKAGTFGPDDPVAINAKG